MTKEEGKKYYELASSFLYKKEDKTLLDSYMVPDPKPKNMKELYFRFLESAQDKNSSPNIRAKRIGELKNLEKVLFDLDVKEVSIRYPNLDCYEQLLNEIESEFPKQNKIRKSNRSFWPQYCKTIIASAHFLNQFCDVEDFYSWARSFPSDYKSKLALPLLISNEIFGFGLPVACNLLKDLGFEFGKPDVHLKDFFKEFGIIKSSYNEDKCVLQAIDEIAKINGTTAYAVDRLFWLIGSGYFFRHPKMEKHPEWKKEFLAEIAALKQG